ncbi:adenylyltransferase/cytidyltransferase family protein [Candidatus Kaiserbacteria bacterium]|nr:adenylyltransferase/cytidyltransferase family protein [Candidatus Kaiserbacteria bacterium]
MDRSGIFSFDGATGERFIADYKTLAIKVQAIKELGGRVVLTSGSFDLIHIGHARYLREARKFGDFLVVGVESDKRIQKRKGPNRPIVPEQERVEALTHLRYVDLVVMKHVDDKPRELISTVQPDVLVISERTKYDETEQVALQKICGEVVELPSQAETSTSARLRQLQLEALEPAVNTLEEALRELKALQGDRA